MKKILGLDLSLTSTGYSCDGETGVVQTKERDVIRLHNINAQVQLLLSKFDMPACVIEGYSFASKNSQSHSIGELGGVIKLTLHNLDIPFVIVPPTVRAKFATGKGNAGKNEVVSAVSARTGIVWSGSGADDKCDAFILEEMGLAATGRARYEWPTENLTALEKVDWSEMEKYVA